jgi:hypothetical protein
MGWLRLNWHRMGWHCLGWHCLGWHCLGWHCLGWHCLGSANQPRERESAAGIGAKLSAQARFHAGTVALASHGARLSAARATWLNSRQNGTVGRFHD